MATVSSSRHPVTAPRSITDMPDNEGSGPIDSRGATTRDPRMTTPTTIPSAASTPGIRNRSVSNKAATATPEPTAVAIIGAVPAWVTIHP